ncbi:hypothetical protein Acy02nite_32890 [Actinoplanes cyaneus]|uniref:Uncharacterized protein n=1 Tax=Actinoplanes cyaneus TaxID=52696 RepID=A0A919M5N8_9ACTN|nr:hypothetical protein [Actinoplanes cyaneus]MCW2140094.1 hypothetical protein [Actinoplanes cyaneus]GID65408.1 hypothetical protein Acy02nite_32890 [Actinoplanes cyaneus]
MPTKARWRTGVLAVLALVSVGFIAWTTTADTDLSDTVAATAGLLIGAGSLAVGIMQLLQTPSAPKVSAVAEAAKLGDDIRQQWLDEATARSVGSAAILPVTWNVEVSEVADADQPDNPWQTVGMGMLNGDFTTAAEEIAKEYRRVDNGR